MRLATVIACAAMTLNAPAQAQSAPAQAPPPSPTPAPVVAKQRGVSSDAQPQSFGHLPIIDIVPIYTDPGDNIAQRQLRHYDPIDVGGTIQIPITRSLSFSFDRNVGGTLNTASERILESGVPTYPTVNRDSVLVERLDYRISRFTIEGGLSYRHRIDAASGVSTARFPNTVSSTEWHYGYLGVTYTTDPIPALANSHFVFNLTADYQPVDQHVAVQRSSGAPVTYMTENPRQSRYYESSESVAVVVPIDPKHGLTFTARDLWGANCFYENAPFPYRKDAAVQLAITKKFNNVFSLTLRSQNDHYAPQGAPYAYPNVSHEESIDVLADFHVDTNKLAHFLK
jgi:hypothetical protein